MMETRDGRFVWASPDYSVIHIVLFQYSTLADYFFFLNCVQKFHAVKIFSESLLALMVTATAMH